MKPAAVSFLQDPTRREAAAGIVLMVSAALALAIANSPLGAMYFAIQHASIGGVSVLHWINDALMALFFLLVGLELKREWLEGQLSTWSQRMLPGVAALGGMVVPALIYVAVSKGDLVALRGWAVPMATDIAFALGVLALLGSRLPVSLKIFLAALAIIDDLGAILVIALFYSQNMSLPSLGLAAIALAALIAMNQMGVARLSFYLAIGALLWVLVLRSGVHATLAGVALALTIPLRRRSADPAGGASAFHRLEHALHPWVAFFIVPVFGFANAGVAIGGMDGADLIEPVPLGIAAGLFFGKQIGVFGFSWLAIRSGRAQLPLQADWLQLYGVALLCGIGFTMSLFIGALAFGEASRIADATKIGVLAGSMLSALAGTAVLLWSLRRTR